MKPVNFFDDIVAQEVDVKDTVDENSATVAALRIHRNGSVGLMWSPFLFTNPNLPLPDAVREELVKTLRFHADRLEDRSMDARMREVMPKARREP
jgi:hypothetical protein